MNTELLKSKLLEAAFNGSLTHADTSKWEYTTIGEAMINLDSQRIPLSVAVRQKLEKNYDYYGASGVIDKVDKYLFDRPLLLIGEDGANLLSRSTPIAFIAKGKYWVNNHAHVLDSGDNICLEFICYYINSISLVPYVTGVAQPKLNQENLNRIPIHLPSLTEQQQIVSALEEGFAAIDAIAEAKENLSFTADMLRSKILQAAFEGSLTGADVSTWKWMPMKKVTTLMCDGDWIEKKDQSDSGIRLVQTGNVGNGRFIDKPNSYKYISEDTFKRLNCTEIFPGDILISRLPSPVGRACELPEVDYRMITAVDCTIIRLNDSILKPLFLYYTQSPTYHYNMAESNFITGTTRARISRSNLEKMPVPVPPLAEQ